MPLGTRLMIDLIDYTERLVRQEILTWPDGTATFTDYLDSDGIERADQRPKNASNSAKVSSGASSARK